MAKNRFAYHVGFFSDEQGRHYNDIVRTPVGFDPNTSPDPRYGYMVGPRKTIKEALNECRYKLVIVKDYDHDCIPESFAWFKQGKPRLYKSGYKND